MQEQNGKLLEGELLNRFYSKKTLKGDILNILFKVSV